jgi:hypothetical protein
MSTTYFIAPYEPESWVDSADQSEKPSSDLVIIGTEYSDKLVSRWPEAHIHPVPHGIIEWNIPSEPDPFDSLVGHLQHNRQIVAFNQNGSNLFYDYILWHRTVIPQTYRLFFFDDTGWDSLELTTTTSQQEIISFLRHRN